MVIKELTTFLEAFAPLAYQEDYDNSGLIVGNAHKEIKKALISLDCTEAIVDEAIKLQCDIVISHHPIVFKGLKKLNGTNYIERVIIKAIKNDIAIYAIHTNLDNVNKGVNAKIAEKLGLVSTRVLLPKQGLLKKLVTYVPVKFADKVRDAVFYAGAGYLGNYSEKSFNVNGTGTFKGNDLSNGFTGTRNVLHQEEETRIETIYPAYLEQKIISTLLDNHPYEEVAYDCFNLENTMQTGSGIVGDLTIEMDETDFLHFVKKQMRTEVIRHTKLLNKKIKKVAVCGGSGSFLLKTAIAQSADAFITADIKYHEFFDADEELIIADIGHFESEQFTQELLLEIITKNFPNFAVRLTENNTNPIKYLS